MAGALLIAITIFSQMKTASVRPVIRWHLKKEEKFRLISLRGDWVNSMYNQRTLHQGNYKPRYPEKYKGNPANIVFRSGLELKYFRFLDYNKKVLQWNSEEVVVPYVSDLDGHVHRYFVDAWAKIKGNGGVIKEYLIEFKPFSFTQEPPQQNRKTQSYQRKVFEYIKNLNKWKAADEYARSKGQKFIILTEKDLR